MCSIISPHLPTIMASRICDSSIYLNVRQCVVTVNKCFFYKRVRLGNLFIEITHLIMSYFLCKAGVSATLLTLY